MHIEMTAEARATVANLRAACNETIANNTAALETSAELWQYVIVSELWNRRAVSVNKEAQAYQIGPVARRPCKFAGKDRAARIAANFARDMAAKGKPEAFHVMTLRAWHEKEITDARAVLASVEHVPAE